MSVVVGEGAVRHAAVANEKLPLFTEKKSHLDPRMKQKCFKQRVCSPLKRQWTQLEVALSSWLYYSVISTLGPGLPKPMGKKCVFCLWCLPREEGRQIPGGKEGTGLNSPLGDEER